VTNAQPLNLSSATVDEFLGKTTEDAGFAAEVAVRAGWSAAETATLLGDLASEVHRAATLLANVPYQPGHLLEIGSGPGLVAALLHQQGADVTGLDPIQHGWDVFMAVRQTLTDHFSMPTIMPICASELDPGQHGTFDTIFSVNVLEHMLPLHPNLDGVARVLAPSGLMAHTCPNYRVPYEPHYRVTLVPGRPAWTRYVARTSGRQPVWRSLNWITAGDIRRFARRNDLTVSFSNGEMTAALDRLRYDPAFARRQRGPVVATLRALDAIGVARLLGRLPATWMTPMTFTVTRPA
jgi:2-polyprenyl-3-methyl-5-hydroxy-6-metoxy-1,4-benzoquinol methylase